MKSIAIAVFTASLFAAGLASAEVKIGGNNDQSVKTGKNVIIANAAIGSKTVAKQNLASNQGKVSIGGNNKQSVQLGDNNIVANAAIGSKAVAIQNLASNSSATE
jgi:hypothetical protein